VRPFRLDDVSELASILSDADVMKYSVRGVCDESETRVFIEWCMSCYVSHDVGPWALVHKEDLNLIGFCGIYTENIDGVEELSLGYRLAKQYWGKGLASESVKGVLQYAFDIKALKSVVVIIEPENVASLRVAEKAGFTIYNVIDYHSKKVRLYRLNQEQW